MARSRNNPELLPRTCRRFHEQQEGQVTLLTLVALLALMVLCGFIGNAGHAVTQKMEVQNAADAAALESAQWMARGMNAVTATNHLIGEATAILVMIDALGGPEALHGETAYPRQSEKLDEGILRLKPRAHMQGTYAPPPLQKFDEKLVSGALKFTTPQDRIDRSHRAFATIYDSKITLKRELIEVLLLKSFSNVGFYAPPIFGFPVFALIAAGVHIVANIELVLIVKEWLILEAFERFLTFEATKEALRGFRDLVADTLVPMLAKHGDFLAGNLGRERYGGSASDGQANQGIVNHSMIATLLDLKNRHQVQAFVYPAIRDLRLPIEREPGPSMSAGATLDAWGSDRALSRDSGPVALQMREMQNQIKDSKDDAGRERFALRQEIARLDEQERKIDSLLRQKDLTDEQRRSLEDDKSSLRRSRRKVEGKISKLEADMKKMDAAEQDFVNAQRDMANLPKDSGNLTATHIKGKLITQLHQDEERQTQWVRATHPYVDAFRAGLLSNMESQLKRSGAAKHWEKWTNRFTLIKSWEFRSGYRYEPKAAASWVKQEEALQMYVMQGAYPTGTRSRPSKGHEAWTRSDREGKSEAEEMFTLVAVAHRKFESLFSPALYPVANRYGITTFAQAIFYNANPQEPAEVGTAPSGTQAQIGWDTLNWSAEAAKPEWGTEPSRAADKWPWEIFSAARSSGTAAVKLNWQAKLMPVQKGRLEKAAASPGDWQAIAPFDARLNLGMALVFFDDLVTH